MIWNNDFYSITKFKLHNNFRVEFEDSLGRTRKCLRKDLKEMKAKDSKLASSLRPPTPPQPTQQLLSRDMQRELMRQKWEEQETALIGKNNVHYQDVLFDGKSKLWNILTSNTWISQYKFWYKYWLMK